MNFLGFLKLSIFLWVVPIHEKNKAINHLGELRVRVTKHHQENLVDQVRRGLTSMLSKNYLTSVHCLIQPFWTQRIQENWGRW